MIVVKDRCPTLPILQQINFYAKVSSVRQPSLDHHQKVHARVVLVALDAGAGVEDDDTTLR